MIGHNCQERQFRQADSLKALRWRVRFEALQVECYDCGALPGSECKPEYGCDDLSRACGHHVPR